MKKMCESIDIPFYSIKPNKSYYDLLNKYGFPSKRARWCNSQYKMDAKRQLEQLMLLQGRYVVSYIGFCADETKRFKYEIGKIAEGQRVIYPIAEEGINEIEILNWARTNKIFDDFYKINDRQGCMYCPMLKYKEMAYQMIKYPQESQFYWKEVFKMWNKDINVLRGDNYDPVYIYKRVKEYYVPKVMELLNEG